MAWFNRKLEISGTSESPELKAANEKLKPFSVRDKVKYRSYETAELEDGWEISAFNNELNRVVLTRLTGNKDHPSEFRNATVEELLEWNPEYKTAE